MFVARKRSVVSARERPSGTCVGLSSTESLCSLYLGICGKGNSYSRLHIVDFFAWPPIYCRRGRGVATYARCGERYSWRWSRTVGVIGLAVQQTAGWPTWRAAIQGVSMVAYADVRGGGTTRNEQVVGSIPVITWTAWSGGLHGAGARRVARWPVVARRAKAWALGLGRRVKLWFRSMAIRPNLGR